MSRSLESHIKMIATLGAAASLVAWLFFWVDDPTIARTVALGAAALATVVFFAVWRIPSAPPFIIVATTAVLTVSATAVVPGRVSQLSASVALVMIAIVGVVLLRSYRRVYLVTACCLLQFVPFLSDHEPGHSAIVGSSMALSVAIGGSIVYLVIVSNERLRERTRHMFQTAPVAMLEQDWTDAVDAAARLGVPSQDELQQWFVAHPDDFAAIVDRVTVVHRNDAAGDLWQDPGNVSDQILTPDPDHPESLEAIAGQAAAVVFGGEYESEYDTVIRRHDHPLTVQIRSIVRNDVPGRRRVLVMVNDVTARVMARRRLERALATKDQFIASVSHELRTPLAAVVGMTATILEQSTLESDDQELLEIAAQQANEMAHIIEDLLVAARADSHSLTVIPEAIDPAVAAAAVVNGHPISISNPGGEIAWADPIRLRQILRNLVTNAQRYGVEPVEVTVRSAGEHVSIEVTDRGEPIPATFRSAIFDPYERVDPEGGLTASVGLGLAVSRTLARLMGGDLEYRHDGRSVFSVTVPRPPGPPEGS